jgi:hypothetical protein
MEHVNKYVRARAAYAVVWTKLIQLAQKADNGGVIFVFEGKDDLRYYLPRIEQYFGSYPEKVIIAQGKDNVLKLRGDLSEKNLKLNAAFFLDRDFDKPADLSGKGTYVTPAYSIENLFAKPQTIERFLTEEMHLVDQDDVVDKEEAVLRYNNWLASFAASILPHCAWLKLNLDALTALQETDRNILKANFLTSVAQMNWRNGEICTQVLLPAHMLHTLYPSFKEFSEQEIHEELRVLCGTFESPADAVRGKFLLPFLKVALSNLIEDSNRRENREIFSKRRKCVIQITEAAVMPTLARSAYTPICLQSFLERLATPLIEGAELQLT